MHIKSTLTTTGLLLSLTATAATTTTTTNLPILQPWNASDWQSSDDSVRGGRSASRFDVLEPSIARFSGTLDIEALNRSGFASQRTVDDWPPLNLSAFSALVLDVPFTDGKTYTLNLKDTVVPPVDGREQASLSWAFDFQLPATADPAVPARLVIPFNKLVPTFQGRVQQGAAPLDLASIKRINIMIRSFFGRQEQAGAFELRIKSIEATAE